MRDRLIELIQDSVNGCARHWAEVIAGHLLENGVVILPCKAGDTLYGLRGWRPTEVYSFVVPDTEWILKHINDFGILFFFTYEEAEKKKDVPRLLD